MREIKFRGKRFDNNEWVYGSYVYYKEEDRHFIVQGNKKRFQFYEVFSDTVGQYIGLKDKNNKKIYEGDIVLIPSLCKDEILEDGSGPEDECPQISEIVEQDGCFGIIAEKDELFNKRFYSFREIKKDIGVDMKEIEVIGNVYDNPELKGGK